MAGNNYYICLDDSAALKLHCSCHNILRYIHVYSTFNFKRLFESFFVDLVRQFIRCSAWTTRVPLFWFSGSVSRGVPWRRWRKQPVLVCSTPTLSQAQLKICSRKRQICWTLRGCRDLVELTFSSLLIFPLLFFFSLLSPFAFFCSVLFEKKMEPPGIQVVRGGAEPPRENKENKKSLL